KNLTGRKNILLTVVALILVMMLVVGVSYSWIEQISNVEFEFPSGVENPMHISTDRLNKPAEAELNGGTTEVIDLSKYFYESGNMHLSSCYSDGKTFYFPKKSDTGASTGTTYRLGTKDDANVNYISVSFKITNKEAYDQVYWFYKPQASEYFFKTKSSADTNLDKLIRSSITVDGATSVFSASDTPTYKTIDSITDDSAESNLCQSYKAYQYDSAHMTQDDKNNDNLSSTRGANGNTLFTLAAGRTSTINIKVWLEYDSENRSASLSDVDMKLVSSFTKTRTITFDDKSIYGEHSWMGSGSATLWMLLKDENKTNIADYTLNENYWQLTNNNGVYSVTIPAYYNNKEVTFLRCGSGGFGVAPVGSGETIKYYTGNIQYWNKWETTLPDSFDNRTFTEYTPEFGSWSSKVHHFYYVDSWNWEDNTHVYLWDNKTASADTKVVENNSWPGDRMYWASGLSVTSGSTTISGGKIGNTHRIYTVFYDSDFTSVIFNNGQSGSSLRQTGDLWIPSAIDDYDYYYDLRSGQWVTDIRDICYHDSNNNVTFTGSSNDEHFYYSDNSSSIQYATKHLNEGDFYNFQIRSTTYNHYFKPNGNNWTYKYELSPNTEVTVVTGYSASNYICIKESDSSGAKYTGMYTIKLDTSNNKVSIRYPDKATPGTTSASSSSSGSSSGSGDSGSSGDTTAITTTQPTEEGIYLYGNLSNSGRYTEFAKFSSSAVNGYVDLNLTKNGTYTIFIWKRSGTTNYQMGQNESGKSITLSSSTNGSDYRFTNGQSNILTLNVENSGTYRFKISEISGNNYVQLLFYNKNNLS
ncbi:MAG: hypothetical protein IJ725_04310, partial [Ruminococcus sp.]|nr:hypothetical protein [Ruminococcus sp.]